jgi:iron(III) transport system substrate-binding protein
LRAAATAEGKLALSGPPGSVYREALLQFGNTYPGVQVEYHGISGRDFAVRINAERGAGQYLWDLSIGGSGTMMYDIMPYGGIDPLPRDLPQTLPGVNDDKWRGGFDAGFMDNAGKYSYAFSTHLNYSAYVNRDVVPLQALSSPSDLLKPEFAGRIVWNDPTRQGSGQVQSTRLMLALGEQAMVQLWTTQRPVVTSDLRQQIEWLVRGQYPIAIGIDTAGLDDFQRQGVGLNVKPLVSPDAAVETNGFGTLGLINRAPHPNAARLYINWLLSPEAQTIWAERTQRNSRRLDVPVADPETLPQPGVAYLNLNKEEAEESREKALKLAKDTIR